VRLLPNADFPTLPGSIGIAVKAALTAAYRLTSKEDLPDGLWRLRHNTARPDILAADEAQPVDALILDSFRTLRRPMDCRIKSGNDA
jgi:hypothetical protein